MIFVYLIEQSKLYPKCQLPLIIQLKYLQGESFSTKFNQYIKHATSRSVPSLFANVKSLYNDKDKVELIEGIITNHITSLKEKIGRAHV